MRPGEVERTSALHRDVLALRAIFEQAEHISCFELLGYGVAHCIHEEEEGHAAGTVELGFWTDDPTLYASHAHELGHVVSEIGYADGKRDPLLTDASGTQVRIGRAPSAS